MQQARLDLITENASENVRRVQARDLGASVVQAIFRLVKQSMVHSIDNQAVVRQVEDAAHIINDYGQRTDLNVSLLFAYGSIFVGGQLLKANRQTYDGAMELGDFLKKFGYSELAIAKGVTPQDLFSFVSAISEANRSNRGQVLEKPSNRIRMRAVGEAALKRGATVERLDENQAVVRAYASAIVIMRRFFEQLKKGRYDLPQRVKRIAQSLVDLSAGETPAFLGVTAARNANHDEAGKAVNSAILAVSVARQVSDDIVGLVRVAMAALLYDIAKPRLTGTVGPTPPLIIPRLSDAQELEVPAATAAVLTALGRVNEPSVMRTVIAYEAHWFTRQRELGPLYRGLRATTLQARIIAITRRFNDLLTPAPGADPLPADDAIARIEADATDSTDLTVVRMLVGALGIFPTGTLLQLGTGEMGLVIATPAHPSHYSMPRVRLHFDPNGGRYAQPIDVDLATLPANDPRKQIVRLVAPADENSRAQARAVRGGQPAQAQQAAQQHAAAPAQGLHPLAALRPAGFVPQHTPTGLDHTPASNQSAQSHPSAQSFPSGQAFPSGQSNPFTPTGQNAQGQAHGVPPARPSARTPPPQQQLQPQQTAQPHVGQVRQPTPAPLGPGDPGWEEQAAYESEQRAYQQRLVEYQKQLEVYQQQLAAYNAQQSPQAPPAEGQARPAPGHEDTSDDGASTRAVAWSDQASLMAAMNSPAPVEARPPIALAPDPAPRRITGEHAASPRRNTGEHTGPAPRRNTGEQAVLRRNTGEVAVGKRTTGEHQPSGQASPAPPGAAAKKDEAKAPPATPTAEGNLTKTPLVHLLVYMLDQRLTGTTEFHTPEGPVHSVYFDKGVPSKVRTGVMVYPLDRVLLEMGLLDEIKLRDSLMEMSKKNILHGRYLVSKGLVDGPTILKALKLQLVRKLVHLFEMTPSTRYAFFADVNMLESYGGPELTPCEPLSLIMTGVRMRAEDPLIDQTLGRLKARPLGLHIDAELKRFEFRKDEAAIGDVLRIKRMSLDEILNSGVGQERIIRLTLYALAITRHLDIGAQGKTPIGLPPKGSGQSVSGVIERPPAGAPTRAVASAGAPAPAAPPSPPAEEIHAAAPSPPQVQAAQPSGAGLGIDFSRMAPKAPTPSPAYAVAAPQYAAPGPEAGYAAQPQAHAEAYAPPQAAYAPAPQQSQEEYAPPPSQRGYGQPQGGYPPSPAPAYPAAPYAPPQPPQYEQSPQGYAAQGYAAQEPVDQGYPAQGYPAQGYPAQGYPAQGYPAPAAAYASPAAAAYAPQAQAYQAPSPPAYAAPQAPQYSAPIAPAPYAPPAAPSSPHAAPVAPPAAPSAPAAAGPRLSEDHLLRKREIESKAENVDNEDFFAMLGLDRKASPSDIQTAYFKVAKTWHPDRLPAELADVKPLMSKVFAKYNEAYAVLNDTAKRNDYIKTLEAGGGVAAVEDEQVRRVVDAAFEFQKAEIYLKKNDLSSAEQSARSAATADPDQGEYVALFVWIQSVKRGDGPVVAEGKTSSFYDDLITQLDAVIKKEPNLERALFYRASLLKRSGKDDKALRDFRQVATLNPKNIDAVRELRLFQMRKEKKSDGIMGKLFKK